MRDALIIKDIIVKIKDQLPSFPDINECVEANPCLEDAEHWCLNFAGGYACCNMNSTVSDWTKSS